jgi:hypothetical protein
MTAVWARLLSRWEGLAPSERADAHAIALCAAVYLVHYAIFSWWYIEDAAISFAFARNAAWLEGFVPTPGGERIEGFSNPTWTIALALLQVVGITPFISAKLLGAVAGVAALWPTLRWARRVVPDGSAWPLAAPLLLALSPQFVLWNGSGLENSFFVALLAIGAARILEEVAGERGGVPWSALAFSLLAMTRPEAPLYAFAAGVGGFGLGLLRSPREAVIWAVKWGALLLAPFAAWHAWRWSYFAWEFPNTYYAKLAEGNKFQPYDFGVRGWSYLRRYAFNSAQGFLLPLYAVGQTGLDGWRVAVALVAFLTAFALWLPGIEFLSQIPFWPLYEPHPSDTWARARVGSVVACFVVLPIVGVGRPGHGARVMALGLAAVALFFALYSGGDWMKGYRWLSMAQPPLAVLVADVAHLLATGIAAHLGAGRLSRGVGSAVIAVPAVVGVVGSGIFLSNPETMPYDVARRVSYMSGVQRRLHLDHVTDIDVDMGAHLWWTDWRMVDMAGLVDVPGAHHKWSAERPFVRQYVFEEEKPHFAHVHGSWATKSGIPKHKEWTRDYVEIDGYPTSPSSVHPGNHVRRDVLVQKRWPGTRERIASFEGGVVLEGLDVPATSVGAGEELYVEIGTSVAGEAQPFRTLLFVAGPGGVVVHDLPPAYDFVPVADWKAKEVWIARHSMPIPGDLAPGTYDLGLLVLAEGKAGGVLAVSTSNGTAESPRLAAGEVRWAGAIEVLAPGEAVAAAQKDLEEAVALADRDCAASEKAWARARRHLGREHDWQGPARAEIGSALAGCWARHAATLPEEDAVPVLVKARLWDREQADVVRVAGVVADHLEKVGDEKFAARDAKGAYAAFRDVMRVDPTRSWTRRRAEEARDLSLGLEDWPAEAPPLAEGR